MTQAADVCLLIEGGYPYLLGGVASWTDAYIRTSPQLKFHVVSIMVSSQPRVPRFKLPENVTGVTDVLLDKCRPGTAPSPWDWRRVAELSQAAEETLATGDATAFASLVDGLKETGYGQEALLDSRPAWRAFEAAYERFLPGGSFLGFFWSWRFLLQALLSISTAPVANARVFHALGTGFAGLMGSYAKVASGRPLVITEHGIYTNERRIDMATADWLFDSGKGGFDAATQAPELRRVWLQAYNSLSRLAYANADIITSQYKANQHIQRQDGAPEEKLRIIPNGIDVERLAAMARDTKARRPTVLMIGRIVPIKDTRTFLMAVAQLKAMVPDVVAVVIGPEEEDPAYASECRQLVTQLDIEANVRFLGRVPDVFEYLLAADVIVLTSISEAQPIVILEAGAIGVPVVSTDVGSCREVIEGFDEDPVKGAGGIVVDPCDPTATAKALATILRDAEMRQSMGDVMRRRMSCYYHRNRVRGLYEGLYDELNAASEQGRPQ
ncbi:GT4 family glycosyltransferase PelF [Blastochloris tepida]|uniref:Pellicle/biofilm biosynthesis glycosyltransferase PelF n=1 Tax=Blastochloris tepida TaxID=2233851 RepID=A0A348G058_9HYPH|nr:GT4 family glycosyltransferase PelF [Blastochloris tepida]BBF92941.1 pellicle/biofilm biosynthesis glycosyltransferase PelF [Blastochloris tepida]